jgi:glutaminyl-tRNA synthetase
VIGRHQVDSKDYFGLAVGKTVMLRWAFPITCVEAVKNKAGEVIELRCEFSRDKTNRPKGVIHWVGEPSPGVSPMRAEVRLYDKLFHSEDPNSVDDWLADINQGTYVPIPTLAQLSVLAYAHRVDA